MCQISKNFRIGTSPISPKQKWKFSRSVPWHIFLHFKGPLELGRNFLIFKEKNTKFVIFHAQNFAPKFLLGANVLYPGDVFYYYKFDGLRSFAFLSHFYFSEPTSKWKRGKSRWISPSIIIWGYSFSII